MIKYQNIRKIIHVDMDAFYASIEQRDNPQYRRKPVAVGGIRERGVVAAASYEARKYGVRSAMPTVTALKKCPGLIVIQPRFDIYSAISEQIMEIFHIYTDLVEPLSLDEAFLDVTGNKMNIPSATIIAREIKERIRMETGLTASAGISFNKFLAKIASDMDKPDGLFVILPQEAGHFIEKLSVEKFYGVGKATAQKMHEKGIYTGQDLKKFSLYDLTMTFGKNGKFFYDIVRGIDDRPVNPLRIRKSYGAERTYSMDIGEVDKLKSKIEEINEILWEGLQESGFEGRTITLKIKFADFIQVTRSHTMKNIVKDPETILLTAFRLLENELPLKNKIRLLGLTISNPPSAGEPDETYPLQLTIDF